MGEPESYPNPPTMVGLCPGEHLGEFYVPREEGESLICPMCDEHLVIYARQSSEQSANAPASAATNQTLERTP